MKYSLYFTIAAIFWGLNFHLGKIMFVYSNYVEAGFWRYSFGVTTLLILLIRHESKQSILLQSISLLSIFLKHKKAFLSIGICLFFFNYIFLLALSQTQAINSSLIAALNPAIILLLSSMILKTKIKPWHIMGIIPAFTGVVYLTFKGNFASISQVVIAKGDLWMVVACVFFALQHVWVKKYGEGIKNEHITFFTNLICVIGFIVVVPFYGMGDVAHYPVSYWLAAMGMGVCGTAIAFWCWNTSIAAKGAAQAGVFINVIPLSTSISAYAFGEQIELYHLISASLIICGILFMQRAK